MKRTFIISVCLALSIAATAQQKKTYHSSKPSLSPAQQKMLCKPWKLDTIEEFGVYKAANASQQHDGVTFMADSTLFLTMDGVAKTGKWMVGWNSKTINTVTGEKNDKMSFTIMKLSDNWLELENQTEDLRRIHYYYSAK